MFKQSISQFLSFPINIALTFTVYNVILRAKSTPYIKVGQIPSITHFIQYNLWSVIRVQSVCIVVGLIVDLGLKIGDKCLGILIE